MQQTIHDKTLLCDQFNTTEIQTWIAVCSVTFTGHPSLTDRVLCDVCLTVPADEPQTTDRSAGIPCQAATRRRGFQDRCRQIRGWLHRDVSIRHDISMSLFGVWRHTVLTPSLHVLFVTVRLFWASVECVEIETLTKRITVIHTKRHPLLHEQIYVAKN